MAGQSTGDSNWPFGCGGVECTLQLHLVEPGSERFHPLQAHPCSIEQGSRWTWVRGCRTAALAVRGSEDYPQFFFLASLRSAVAGHHVPEPWAKLTSRALKYFVPLQLPSCRLTAHVHAAPPSTPSPRRDCSTLAGLSRAPSGQRSSAPARVHTWQIQ